MIYRLILYKQIEQVWHYVRLSIDRGTLCTEMGCCGLLPERSETAPANTALEAREVLKQAGLLWQQRGYGKPGPKELSIMTLHFQLPLWKGAPAGAPWFDAWTDHYLDPIQKTMEETCNAIPKGDERFSGNHLYYYRVLNPELAKAAVETVAEKAQHRFSLDISIDKHEKPVSVSINPDVPDFLQSMLRGFEQTARLLAREWPLLTPVDPLQPENRPLTPDNRIRGAEAEYLRHTLKEKWGFNCQQWTPPPFAQTEARFGPDELSEDLKQTVIESIAARGTGPCYLLECDHGLFQIAPEQIFSGVYEGIAFDAEFEWAIYFSRDFTVTFLSLPLSPLLSGNLSIVNPIKM